MIDEFDCADDSGAADGEVVLGFGWRGIRGFAVGMFLIVLATVLNFALDKMSPDDVASLPWYIGAAFESGGKFGVTVVLCSIGLMLMLWQFFVNSANGKDPKAGFSAAARHGTRELAKRPTPPPPPEATVTTPDGEEIPLAEEVSEDDSKPKKIPALRGRFTAPGRVGGPVGTASEPPPNCDSDGTVVLQTAKYLNTGKAEKDERKSGARDFRKSRGSDR